MHRLWKRFLVMTENVVTFCSSADIVFDVMFSSSHMSILLLDRGDDYKNHNKCISEDQKYGGKGFEAKANKGEVKQQQWIEVK